MDSEKVVTALEEKAEELSKIADGANTALAEMRIQFETLAEMQKEERLERDKMHNAAVEKILDKCEREVKHWKHICIGLIVALCIFIGGLFGSVLYFFANYDIMTFDMEQNIDIGGDGNPEIHDGIHYNTD